jgi:hypothetical protein
MMTELNSGQLTVDELLEFAVFITKDRSDITDLKTSLRQKGASPEVGWMCDRFDAECASRVLRGKSLSLDELCVTNEEARNIVHCLALADNLSFVPGLEPDVCDVIVSCVRHTGLPPTEMAKTGAVCGLMTGCNSVAANFYSLVLRHHVYGTKEFNDLQGMILHLHYAAGSRYWPGVSGCINLFSLDRQRQMNKSLYMVPVFNITLDHLFARDITRNAVDLAYLVHISHVGAPATTKPPSTSDLWATQTSRPHDATHTFMIRIVGAHSVVMQAFFGYYDIETWMDFDSELLVPVQLPEPASVGWRQPLLRRPRFRGLLNERETAHLFKALKNLSGKEAHASYAQITGVQFEELSALKLSFVRLNLSGLD